MDNQHRIENRRHKRSDFAFPVEIKLLTSDVDHVSFTGFIQNMSISGGCIQFEDRYGRLDRVDFKGSHIKMGFNMPKGDKIVVTSLILWSRKDTEKKFHINIGVEFQDLQDWQLESIKKLISHKKKDRNMMWNLLEQYENNYR